MSDEPPTSKDTSRSPFWRQGIVRPSPFVQSVALWLSSKARKVLPVMSLRQNAICANVVPAGDSWCSQAARMFDLPGVQPPALTFVSQAEGVSSLLPPMKQSSAAWASGETVEDPA